MRIENITHVHWFDPEPVKLRVDDVLARKCVRPERGAHVCSPIFIRAIRIGDCLVYARVPKDDPVLGVFDDGSGRRNFDTPRRESHQHVLVTAERTDVHSTHSHSIYLSPNCRWIWRLGSRRFDTSGATIDGRRHVQSIFTASRSGRLIAVRHYRTDERIFAAGSAGTSSRVGATPAA